jgi:hypothetical protein
MNHKREVALKRALFLKKRLMNQSVSRKKNAKCNQSRHHFSSPAGSAPTL